MSGSESRETVPPSRGSRQGRRSPTASTVRAPPGEGRPVHGLRSRRSSLIEIEIRAAQIDVPGGNSLALPTKLLQVAPGDPGPRQATRLRPGCKSVEVGTDDVAVAISVGMEERVVPDSAIECVVVAQPARWE